MTSTTRKDSGQKKSKEVEMANKVTISKKLGRDTVVVVEAESNNSAQLAAKDAVAAIESIKVK